GTLPAISAWIRSTAASRSALVGTGGSGGPSGRSAPRPPPRPSSPSSSPLNPGMVESLTQPASASRAEVEGAGRGPLVRVRHPVQVGPGLADLTLEDADGGRHRVQRRHLVVVDRVHGRVDVAERGL